MAKFVFPERTYQHIDSDTKAVLDIVNMIRKAKGWAEIPDLPMGSKYGADPICLALTENGNGAMPRKTIATLCEGLDLTGRVANDDYYAVVTWLDDFDEGMLHSYDVDWEPSDDEIYRNNPHVHADAEHPKNPVNPNRQDWH
jgi:hypothetical protein